eukprot:gnl/MRDRNA2_/MRDRNA2_193994_c0_seq1.p1 gnl/MRDRNA2_/MRDRNA2_193994_c0~~gnl/MRDRNA2_/MRDRNA2_193994_c0_seq1.p1  ORF type:complete len:681 (+),score=105.67 gnl/MRDRNA2_/MRDRNA2_193994_c0_seq1:46-2043(+)
MQAECLSHDSAPLKKRICAAYCAAFSAGVLVALYQITPDSLSPDVASHEAPWLQLRVGGRALSRPEKVANSITMWGGKQPPVKEGNAAGLPQHGFRPRMRAGARIARYTEQASWYRPMETRRWNMKQQQYKIARGAFSRHRESGQVVKPFRLGSSRCGFAGSRRVRCDAKDSKSDAPLEPHQPAAWELIRFALPVYFLWIGGPVLSLIGSSAVGLSASEGTSAAQLAALGPATTFCDGVSYLFAFLNVATTNLYASAPSVAQGADAIAMRREAVVRRAAKVSVASGFATLALLFFIGKWMLAVYIGTDVASADSLLNTAWAYVFVRMLSLPAALLANALEAALLGAKDSMTPMLVTAGTSIAEVIGCFVACYYLQQGVVGAAFATLVAVYAQTVWLLRVSLKKLVPRTGLSFLPAFGKPRTGLNANSHNEMDIPTSTFLRFAAPVLTLILGKITCFGFMTHVAAALGEAELAAHQLTLSLYFFLSPSLEAISQTAQAFLPQFTPPSNSSNPDSNGIWQKASDTLALRLTFAACAVAVAAGATGGLITWIGTGLFTPDALVASEAKTLSLPLALGVLLAGPVAVGEGVLLARRRLGFLAGVYASTTAVVVIVLLLIKQKAGAISDVWMIFAAFQLVRAAAFTGRIWGPRFLDVIGWRRMTPKPGTT